MKLAIVQGTRPEIIKNYSVVKAVRRRGIPCTVVHTNQHSTTAMRDAVYACMDYRPDLIMPAPARIGSTIDRLQRIFRQESVTQVVVNGDTAAALAGAIAAMYLDIPVTHIEAGLRADDPVMLEERNRIMVDMIAARLFAYTEWEAQTLRSTPGVRGEVLVEGNTTVDVIHDFASHIRRPEGLDRYIFVTLHRRELTDDRTRFAGLLDTLSQIAEEILPVVFPVHPRTRDAMQRHRLQTRLSSQVRVLRPATVFESFGLQRHAALVATDSGCVQEEAYILGTRCITLRERTERHLTVHAGANAVTGFDHDAIIAHVEQALGRPAQRWPDLYGAPGVGERIVARMLK